MIDPHAPLGQCCEEVWTAVSARIERAGPHWKATCGICGKYLTFLPQRAKDFKLFFGKHKGKLLVEVWRTDPDYCRWLRAQPWLMPRLREVLDETKGLRA